MHVQQVWRFLRVQGIDLAGRKSWCQSPNPEFAAKAAMMTALDHHLKRVPQSQRCYEPRRADGKKHNQAIRALGRHLCRVIFKIAQPRAPLQDRSPTKKPEAFFKFPLPISGGMFSSCHSRRQLDRSAVWR